MRVQPFKRGQWKARDKVKTLKAGHTEESLTSTERGRKKKVAMHAKAAPSGQAEVKHYNWAKNITHY